MPISRRQFVARTAAAAAALPFVSPLAAARPARRAEFLPIRRGVGAFVGRGGTIGYLDTADALVAVDAQFPEPAQAFLDGLSARAGRGLDLLVNTHHHGDHTAGNAVLAAVAAMHVAHDAVPGLQRAAAVRSGALGVQRYASETFERSWSADLGDEVVSARYYGPAHTCGDIVVHFENADVVHMGDLVFNGRQPFIDGPGGALTTSWMEILQTVHDRHADGTVFVFGHAGDGFEVTGGRADLLRFRDFLGALNAEVRRRRAAGQDAAAMENMTVPGFEAWGPTPLRVLEPVVAEQTA